MLFFFFSSRRRHTRSLCDWSSDVCSSDLLGFRHIQQTLARVSQLMGEVVRHRAAREARTHGRAGRKAVRVVAEALRVGALELDGEVGRAAVVPGIEAVGLAAGRAAHLDDVYSDAGET